MDLLTAALLLPLDIEIDPNSNGLPGHRPAQADRRRLDDGRADPRRTRPDHLRDRVGARSELVQPAPRGPRQARRPRRPRRRDRLRRLGDAGELLLERRPAGLREIVMGVCDVPVIHEVCNAAGDAAGAVVTAPFDWLAQGMGGAAEWMFTSVWKVIDTTTYVDVTSGEYTKVYNIMFGVGVFVMLGFFMLQVIGGMIRREPAALSRAALGLAKSILGSFVALALLAHRARDHRPALHRHRQRRRHQHERDGRQGRRPRRRARHHQPRRARRRRDPDDLPRQPRHHRRDGRVDQPADPQGAPADRDRLRADRTRRIELGPHPLLGEHGGRPS